MSALLPPDLSAAPYLLCDWAELKALSSSGGYYRLNLLKRAWDVSRETEFTDPEGEEDAEAWTDLDGVDGPDEERFLDSLGQVFNERSEALAGAYPFAVDARGNLTVYEPQDISGYVYIFCLLLTYSNGRELLTKAWRPAVTHQVRDLFQACATLAAAGWVSGPSFSFGWPRPDRSTPFLERIRQIYAIFGEGRVRRRPLAGTSPSPKDQEIDIIAWRPRHDKTSGTTYLLGQVASGDNWMGKPLLGGPINNFHRNWFSVPPASAAIVQPSMFIPHAVPPVNARGTRKERVDTLIALFGLIMDRMILPRLLAEGLQIKATNPALDIERVSDMPAVREWVIGQILSLRAASNDS